MSNSVEIELERQQDDTVVIWIHSRDEVDVVLLNPDDALKLAHRLMHFAHGQGIEKEIVLSLR